MQEMEAMQMEGLGVVPPVYERANFYSFPIYLHKFHAR